MIFALFSRNNNRETKYSCFWFTQHPSKYSCFSFLPFCQIPKHKIEHNSASFHKLNSRTLRKRSIMYQTPQTSSCASVRYHPADSQVCRHQHHKILFHHDSLNPKVLHRTHNSLHIHNHHLHCPQIAQTYLFLPDSQTPLL